jgi:hypothetical protein
MNANSILRRKWFALALVITVVGLPSPVVIAAELQSPPVSFSGGSLVECAIVNVSSFSATVTIRVISNDAELSELGPLAVPPGMSQSARAFCTGICVRPRCTFVTSLDASSFRASACVAASTNTNTDKICLPAE